jgi:hypothetical protein
MSKASSHSTTSPVVVFLVGAAALAPAAGLGVAATPGVTQPTTSLDRIFTVGRQATPARFAGAPARVPDLSWRSDWTSEPD